MSLAIYLVSYHKHAVVPPWTIQRPVHMAKDKKKVVLRAKRSTRHAPEKTHIT